MAALATCTAALLLAVRSVLADGGRHRFVQPAPLAGGGVDGHKPLTTSPTQANRALAVAVCNGTDYVKSDSWLQIERARALACSLHGTETHLVALTHDLHPDAARELRDAGFDVVDVTKDHLILNVINEPTHLRRWPRDSGQRLTEQLVGRNLTSMLAYTRKDGACTAVKLHAWRLVQFEFLMVSDTDVMFAQNPTNWMEQHKGAALAAAHELQNGIEGVQSHMMGLTPSMLVYRILARAATTGGFLPYTNTEQDVIAQVFAGHYHFPPLPHHIHWKIFLGEGMGGRSRPCIHTKMTPKSSKGAGRIPMCLRKTCQNEHLYYNENFTERMLTFPLMLGHCGGPLCLD